MPPCTWIERSHAATAVSAQNDFAAATATATTRADGLTLTMARPDTTWLQVALLPQLSVARQVRVAVHDAGDRVGERRWSRDERGGHTGGLRDE